MPSRRREREFHGARAVSRISPRHSTALAYYYYYYRRRRRRHRHYAVYVYENMPYECGLNQLPRPTVRLSRPPNVQRRLFVPDCNPVGRLVFITARRNAVTIRVGNNYGVTCSKIVRERTRIQFQFTRRDLRTNGESPRPLPNMYAPTLSVFCPAFAWLTVTTSYSV